jgi:hypothetical protein
MLAIAKRPAQRPVMRLVADIRLGFVVFASSLESPGDGSQISARAQVHMRSVGSAYAPRAFAKSLVEASCALNLPTFAIGKPWLSELWVSPRGHRRLRLAISAFTSDDRMQSLEDRVPNRFDSCWTAIFFGYWTLKTPCTMVAGPLPSNPLSPKLPSPTCSGTTVTCTCAVSMKVKSRSSARGVTPDESVESSEALPNWCR